MSYRVSLKCALCRRVVDYGQVAVTVDPALAVDCPQCGKPTPCSEVLIDRSEEVHGAIVAAKKEAEYV